MSKVLFPAWFQECNLLRKRFVYLDRAALCSRGVETLLSPNVIEAVTTRIILCKRRRRPRSIYRTLVSPRSDGRASAVHDLIVDLQSISHGAPANLQSSHSIFAALQRCTKPSMVVMNSLLARVAAHPSTWISAISRSPQALRAMFSIFLSLSPTPSFNPPRPAQHPDLSRKPS